MKLTRSFCWSIATIISLVTGLQNSIKADFTQITLPDSTYTSSTSLINIATISDGTPVSSITDGTQTVSLSSSLTKWTVPVPLGYSFWGSAPFTESSTPATLQTSNTQTSLTLFLSLASNTFGLEIEGSPATPGVSTFTMNFYDNATLVGSISQNVDSDSNNAGAGARLIAATSFSNPFTQVVITAPLSANGFSIAQVRYSVVPEPASIAMMAQAIGAVGFVVWRKRRKVSAGV